MPDHLSFSEAMPDHLSFNEAMPDHLSFLEVPKHAQCAMPQCENTTVLVGKFTTSTSRQLTYLVHVNWPLR
jgi:hypothetical protein